MLGKFIVIYICFNAGQISLPDSSETINFQSFSSHTFPTLNIYIFHSDYTTGFTYICTSLPPIETIINKEDYEFLLSLELDRI